MKKRIFNKQAIIAISLGLMIFFVDINVFAAEEVNFCNSETINAFRILGNILVAIKIIVPLLIIIFGMIDFSRAVISNDEKAIKVSTGALIRRMIAGIFIFFVPTIAFSILKIAVDDDVAKNAESIACTQCMLKVSTCDSLAKELPEK